MILSGLLQVSILNPVRTTSRNICDRICTAERLLVGRGCMLWWVVADKAVHRKLLYGQFLGKLSKMCHYEQTNSDCHLGKQTKVWKPEQDIILEGQVQCSLLAEKPVIVETPLTSMVLCFSNHETSIHKTISGLYLCIAVQQRPENSRSTMPRK